MRRFLSRLPRELSIAIMVVVALGILTLVILSALGVFPGT
jgi:hypothetical protein